MNAMEKLEYQKKINREFIKACEKGNLNKVIQSLELGLDINGAWNEAGNPLEHALINGKLNVVRFLINNGAKIPKEAFNLASYSGNTRLVKYLRKTTECNIDCVGSSSDMTTPLIAAIDKKNYKMISVLLKMGANTESLGWGSSPLENAITDLKMVKILIEKGNAKIETQLYKRVQQQDDSSETVKYSILDLASGSVKKYLLKKLENRKKSSKKDFLSKIYDKKSSEVLNDPATMERNIKNISIKKTEYEYFIDTRNEKKYITIKIGDQTWMAENFALNYGDGCWFYNNIEMNKETYGYLYNWDTAIKLCPQGWHLPSLDEWLTLIGNKNASKLKSITDWDSFDKIESNNESGFSVLPGGLCYSKSVYNGIKRYAFFWSSTQENEKTASGIKLSYSDNLAQPENFEKSFGLSIRYIKG